MKYLLLSMIVGLLGLGVFMDGLMAILSNFPGDHLGMRIAYAIYTTLGFIGGVAGFTMALVHAKAIHDKGYYE